MTRFLQTGLVALACLCAAQAGAQSIPTKDDEQDQAYRHLALANRAYEQKQWGNAVASYREARQRYLTLAETAESWSTELIAFRIQHCEERLLDIVERTGRSEQDWLDELDRLADEENRHYRALYETLLSENRYLQQRVDELEEELELYHEMEMLDEDRERAQQQRARPPDPPPPPPEPRTPPRPIEVPPAYQAVPRR